MSEKSVNCMTVKAGGVINYIRGFPLSHGETVPREFTPHHC
jgi:hypothetical protein